jgi:hypothetical protein
LSEPRPDVLTLADARIHIVVDNLDLGESRRQGLCKLFTLVRKKAERVGR